MTDKIVMYEDAAQWRPVSVWQTLDGEVFRDERTARYHGCTHWPCHVCGVATHKSQLRCDSCLAAERKARWEALPLIEWDGETPFVMDGGDEYFFCAEDFYDWCDIHELRPSEVRLVVCVPCRYRQLDDDYWADDLSEDGELPDDVVQALDALNAALAKAGPSWRHGNQRIVMPDHTP